MDEEYKNTVNRTSGSNPWADFEPIDAPQVNNINNRRTISRPEPPSFNLNSAQQPQYRPNGPGDPENPPVRPGPFDQNFERHNAEPLLGHNTVQPQPQTQSQINLNQNLQAPQFQQTAPVFMNTEQVRQRPSAFENIAWDSESSGLEDYSENLKSQNPYDYEVPPTTYDQQSADSKDPVEPAQYSQTPKSDTVMEQTSSSLRSAKPKKLKLKLKYLLFVLLALGLIGGASFAAVKFKNSSVKSTKLKPENQIAAEDIIELAKNNKADEIIKKYVRESNQASFPKDQFKESVLKLSQASSGKPTYINENTAKVIVQPDTNPSDMNAYIYTTNYAGYKGKIYIRVDVFKNSADGKWYLYALAYNSKELKPDLTSSAQPTAESSPAPAAQ